ncbi:cAMP-dependent protein kinase type II-beta regulatory subunit-like [Podargus strigoides]
MIPGKPEPPRHCLCLNTQLPVSLLQHFSWSTGTMSIEIPPRLTELLQGYTVEVLWHRLSDLLGFTADYFTRLWDAHDQEVASGGHGVVSFDREPMQTKSNGKEEPNRSDEDSDSNFEPPVIN